MVSGVAPQPRAAWTDRERARLARELHDGLGGSLAALVLEAERAVRAVGDAPGGAEVRRLSALAAEALEDLRRSTRLMRREFDLEAALRSRLEHTARRLRAGSPERRAELRVIGRPKRLPSELQLSVFRAAQEILTNVERHAGAARVRVALAYVGDVVRLGVRDDGVGLPPDLRAGAGHGLRNLRSRAAAYGGRLELRATAGRGACVIATFHIPAEGSHVHLIAGAPLS